MPDPLPKKKAGGAKIAWAFGINPNDLTKPISPVYSGGDNNTSNPNRPIVQGANPSPIINQPNLNQQISNEIQLVNLSNIASTSNISVCVTPTVKGEKINPDNIKNSSGCYVEFNVKNLSLTDTYNIIIGSWLSQAGSYANYNRPQSACDTPNMQDQYGFQVLAIQGFSKLTLTSPIIMNRLQVASLGNNLGGVRPFTGKIEYDLDINEQRFPSKTCSDCINNKNGYTVYNYDFITGIDDMNYVGYPVPPNTEIILTLYYSGKARNREYVDCGTC